MLTASSFTSMYIKPDIKPLTQGTERTRQRVITKKANTDAAIKVLREHGAIKQTQLVAMLGLNKDTVANLVNRLKATGVFNVDKLNNGRSNYNYITFTGV